ncbi:MAG: sigma-70 family RNA polymerase sigma factor [Sphingopyxis sp.]|nr:sigma-70 family RNA polymerase sigma factor [Sphingopyxis sp.]
MLLSSNERAKWLASHILVHEAGLRSWLKKYPSVNEIDDIIQEAYAILAAIGSVDHIRNPRNYLYEVAKSIVLRNIRNAKIVQFNEIVELDSMSIPCKDPSPEDIAISRDELTRTEQAIGGLSEKCREAFTLRKIQGLSQRDVARHMEISESTVEKHISKALHALLQTVGRGKKGEVVEVSESDARQSGEITRLARIQRAN